MEQLKEKAKLVLEKTVFRKKNDKFPLLDALPVWVPIGFVIFFSSLLVLVFLVIGILTWTGVPVHLISEEDYDTHDGNQVTPFFTDLREIVVDHNDFVRGNDYLTIFLYFKKKDKNLELVDDEIYVNLNLMYRDDKGKAYKTLKEEKGKRLRLECPKGEEKCKGMELYFSETVKYWDYRVILSLTKKVNSYGVLQDFVQIGYKYNDSFWLILENLAGFLLWIIFFVLFLSFLVVNFIFNTFGKWSGEQRMVAILIGLFVLYIDPLYYLDDVYDTTFLTWIFKFYGALCSATFVSFLFFCFHMFIHWAGQPEAKKNVIIWVYSIVLACVYWIIFFVSLLSYRYTRDWSLFFTSVCYSCLISLIFLFPFQLVRLIVLLTKNLVEDTMNTIKRMIFLFGLSLVFICTTFLMLVIKDWTDPMLPWYFEFLFALVVIMMAFNFFPSWKTNTYADSDGLEKTAIVSSSGGNDEENMDNSGYDNSLNDI